MIARAPLEWPFNVVRNESRKSGQFKADGSPITVTAALARLEEELWRHDAQDIEVSAHFGRTKGGNVAKQWDAKQGDPGVCIRYDIGKTAYTLPCDTYDNLAQNIAAIAAHLSAVRAMERYGVATGAQIMGAFASLPAPTPIEPWYAVLGVDVNAPEDVVKAAYRALSRKAHPDVEGGSHDAMSRLNQAFENYEAKNSEAL